MDAIESRPAGESKSNSASLVRMMRQLPGLSPLDSVSRAVDAIRYSGADTLPVLDGFGRLLGVVSLRDFRSLLNRADDPSALLAPVSDWLRAPGATGRPDMTIDEVRGALLAGGETVLFIVDEQRRYAGAVTMSELLAPLPLKPRPARIGGMATPWGVYLTNGTLQAGAGNAALIGSGAMLGLLLAASHFGIGFLCWTLSKTSGLPLYSLWTAPQPAQFTSQTIGWVAVNSLSVPLFLLLLRTVPLAQYHAAEHQAVHAMERGEPLQPEIVRRMPRVHPRCGTNIMAGGLIFTLVSQGITVLPVRLDPSDGAVLGALMALFTWRSVGAFLQQHFTTRVAGEKHIASGIAAATDLEDKFLLAQPGHPGLLRRIWCMGMVQTLAGILAATTVTFWIGESLFERLR